MKKIGFFLIGVSLLVVMGLIINNHILWFIIDLAAVLVCAVCGVILLRKK
ncbi:MAG: hypothetical protein PHF84_07005 [bacterium]|nr:hypothetical protein [bacterium]